MQLHSPRLEVRAVDAAAIEVAWSLTGDELTWTIRNTGPHAVAVDAVAVVSRLEAVEPLRMLRHGYQSWSPTAVGVFRVDQDGSRADGVRSLPLGMHHADPATAEPDELRSELVAAVRDATGAVLLVGALGGAEHDVTLRLRTGRDDPSVVELWIEAYLGGAWLASGEERELHPVVLEVGEVDPGPLLERWADRLGAAMAARTTAPFQVGWCSWYHYFWRVTEDDVRQNLAHAGDWPFDVFQVDDGFQAAIGDWLRTAPSFPSPLDALAGAIAAAGRTPGIWLAPFLAAEGSQVARAHPEWIPVHEPTGRPLVGMVNEAWGGAVHVLDTTDPAVLEHLEDVARSLVEAGFPYLKLDFTYAPSVGGRYADPGRTPAQRVRAGFEAIRRGAGDAAFLLGCGAPLGAAVGVVDGMRIGPDVAPWWHPQPGQYTPAGHEGGEPATVNAWRNTLSRAFQHRRLWLNDPDCLMLRPTETHLRPEEARAWALAVGMSGGMALVSDDLGLLGPDARALLDEVLVLGREVDAQARSPHCADLLDHDPPTRLRAGDRELIGDPQAGTAVLQGLLDC